MRRAVAIIAFATLAVAGLAAVKWPREAGDMTASPPVVSPPVVDAGPAAVTAPSPPDDGEPSKEECLAAIDETRALAGALPADHPSRYVAERYLRQSLAEAGNGEYDDCIEWAGRATEEVRERRHGNEKIKVLQADELPQTTASPVKAATKEAHRKKRRD